MNRNRYMESFQPRPYLLKSAQKWVQKAGKYVIGTTNTQKWEKWQNKTNVSLSKAEDIIIRTVQVRDSPKPSFIEIRPKVGPKWRKIRFWNNKHPKMRKMTRSIQIFPFECCGCHCEDRLCEGFPPSRHSSRSGQNWRSDPWKGTFSKSTENHWKPLNSVFTRSPGASF